MTNQNRVKAVLASRIGQHHDVELELKVEGGQVLIEVLRPRRDAKGDQRLYLSPTQARELMKKLQSRADETDRQNYAAAKADTLDNAVASVAKALSSYQEMIVRFTGATVEEAPLVEAMMRVEHGTLDAITNEQFVKSARHGLLEVKDDTAACREIAKSYGLVRR